DDSSPPPGTVRACLNGLVTRRIRAGASREAGCSRSFAWVALRRANMRSACAFVKHVNTRYCAFYLGQTQDLAVQASPRLRRASLFNTCAETLITRADEGLAAGAHLRARRDHGAEVSERWQVGGHHVDRLPWCTGRV